MAHQSSASGVEADSGSGSSSTGKRSNNASILVSKRCSSLSRKVTWTFLPAMVTYVLKLAGASLWVTGTTGSVGVGGSMVGVTGSVVGASTGGIAGSDCGWSVAG